MSDDEVQKYGKKTNKADAKLVVGIIIVVLVGIFIVQNRSDVTLTVLFFDIDVPLWIGLLVTVLLSLGAGFLLGRGRYKG